MKCKFCQAEMPDDGVFCPYCGKSNLEEPAQTAEVVEAVVEESGEAVVVLEPEAGTPVETGSELEEAMASPQLKKMKRFAIFSGCLAVLAVLATVLYFGITGAGWDFSGLFKWMQPRQDTLLGNASYTVSDRKAWSKRDEVVATLGDAKLTNGELQIYYWMQVIDFLNEYGGYASYFGLDYTQPLDEQQSIEEGKTWQQYFLESAIDAWHSNQAFALMGQEAGFKLDEEVVQQLNETLASVEAQAKKEKFDSADAYLQSQMGAGCDMGDYKSYMETYYNGYMYFAELYDGLELSDTQIEKYFEDNKDKFEENEITKDSGLYYAIRHVMIAAEGGTKDDDGKLVFTDAQWKACQDAAQEIYDKWLAEEAKTEDVFAALAGEYSDDDNNNNDGGLYSGFKKEDMKELFGQAYEDWCVSPERKAGDYALIKSDYGYHIVYFVESEDIWFAEARAELRSELGTDIVKDALEKYTLTVDYKKIVLGEVQL